MLLDKLLPNLAVHVDAFALCMLSAGWRLSLPANPGVMLHFVLKGSGVLRGPHGEALQLAPYWLAVVPSGAAHSLESGRRVQNERRIEGPPAGAPVYQLVAGQAQKADWVVACGLVTVRYGQSMGLFDHLREIIAVDLSHGPQVKAVFKGILTEQSHPGPGSTAMTAALMSQCLVHLFRRLAKEEGETLPWLTALEDPRLARVIDKMLEFPGDDHTVESLSELASMSRSAFAEKFTVAFGRSPMSLVHHVRMQRAAELLHQSTLSIDEVADRVGFASRSHFSRAFKKHCGSSPAEFRHVADAPTRPRALAAPK